MRRARRDAIDASLRARFGDGTRVITSRTGATWRAEVRDVRGRTVLWAEAGTRDGAYVALGTGARHAADDSAS